MLENNNPLVNQNAASTLNRLHKICTKHRGQFPPEKSWAHSGMLQVRLLQSATQAAVPRPPGSRVYFSTRSRLLKSSVHTRKPGGTGISVATLRMRSASSSLRLAVTSTWSVLDVQ